jgi:ABC-type sugar transport system permease subunit
MASTPDTTQTPRGGSSSGSSSALNLILRLLFLMVITAFAIFTGWQLILGGATALAVVLWIIALAFIVVFLRSNAAPLRWIMPGLAFMTMMHIYPVIFTVYTAFTNYSDGHLVQKQVAIQQIESQTFIPPDAPRYSFVPFTSADGTFGLWLTGDDGTQLFKTSTGEMYTREQLTAEGAQFDADGNLIAFNGYIVVPQNRRLVLLSQLQGLTFGPPDQPVSVTSPRVATQAVPRFRYDPAQDAMIDQQTGTVYSNVRGTFTSAEGDILRPGFPVIIGFENFTRLFTSPALRGPLFSIFAWTVIFALFSVLTTFVLGLLLALVLNEPYLPLRRLTRVLMIVPYALPAFIAVLIWRGMLNPVIGIIGSAFDPGWFSSPFWAKVGILIINLWLGYPYMFLITTGALQGIPSDLYEAARVDGASAIQQFWNITLPLLLVSVGPLLVGSFAFNFNNFTIIQLYANGGPPIPGTPTPAGHTDILISYTFKLAFGGGRGADLGLASAIAIVIFVIVGAITILNFRYTGMLEEVSENV